MQNKRPWLSKTLIVNFIAAGLGLLGFGEKLSPDQILTGLAALNFLLRFVTKDKIGLE
jgi:hypothetical protein